MQPVATVSKRAGAKIPEDPAELEAAEAEAEVRQVERDFLAEAAGRVGIDYHAEPDSNPRKSDVRELAARLRAEAGAEAEAGRGSWERS
jgi:hypothetical protein